jgi:hypothetical protein
MVLPASGLFVATELDLRDTTQLAVDYDLETHRGALWSDTGTYDLTADTAYNVAPWNANEISGTGYTAGGELVTGTVFTHISGGNVRFDANDVAWTTVTISAVRGILLYADALAGNNGLMVINFGGLFQVTAGNFTVQWAGTGIWQHDVTS